MEGSYNNISRDITNIASYISANTTVASVTSGGIIKALSPGYSIINISNGISTELAINVLSTCETPQNNMIIRKSINFCPGTYFIPYGMEIDMNNAVIDCHGAVLQGNYTTDAMLIENQLGVVIKNCTIRNYFNGILINNSLGVTVEESNLFYNYFGVHSFNSDYSTLTNNNLHDNGYHGAFFEYSYDSDITSNQFYNNGISNDYGYGIYCRYASSANITNNNIFHHIAPNYAYGIKLLQFDDALIQDNNIFDNLDNSIQIEQSDSNIIRQNTINNNSGSVYITASNNNLIYNNNMINSIIGLDDGLNYWDTNNSGNYWDNYDETTEGCFDSNSDGFCDSPYIINPNGADNYPYTSKDGWLIQSFLINLASGWNMISIPLEPENNTVENIFKNISYSKIFEYDETWKIPIKINTSKAYWIQLDSEDILEVKGSQAKNNVNLHTGWNLIGYQDEILINQTELSDELIYSYNSSWISYIPNRINNTLTKFIPGFGYWIYR